MYEILIYYTIISLCLDLIYFKLTYKYITVENFKDYTYILLFVCLNFLLLNSLVIFFIYADIYYYINLKKRLFNYGDVVYVFNGYGKDACVYKGNIKNYYYQSGKVFYKVKINDDKEYEYDEDQISPNHIDANTYTEFINKIKMLKIRTKNIKEILK